jgi:hypothetical protein
MSAKALANSSFEPALEHSVASAHQEPAGIVAEIQFCQNLWREYRIEAINAGFSTAQATEYASALSPEMGLVAGVSGMAPLERGWFYQSRTWVTNRTVASRVTTLMRWKRAKLLERQRGWRT